MGNDEDSGERTKQKELEAKIEKLAADIGKRFLDSGAPDLGRSISLNGGSEEVRHVFFGELTKYFVNKGRPTIVLQNAGEKGFYSVDVEFYEAEVIGREVNSSR